MSLETFFREQATNGVIEFTTKTHVSPEAVDVTIEAANGDKYEFSVTGELAGEKQEAPAVETPPEAPKTEEGSGSEAASDSTDTDSATADSQGTSETPAS